MAKNSKSSLSTPILYIVLGALLAIFPSEALNWAMTLAGIFFLVSGIIDIAKKKTASGAVSLIIGIVILVLGWTLTNIVLLVLGILIALKGVVELLDVIKSKNLGVLKLLFPILTIIVGLGLAFGKALSFMVTVVGIILIVDGVIGLIGAKK